MRDRLIELMGQAEFAYLDFSKMYPCEKSLKDFTADYLLENGIIVPPCKVGGKVYCIVEGFDVVMEGHIRQLIVAEGIFIDCVIRGYFNQVFHSSKIGKTVFFTKEEADRALICQKSRQVEEGGGE